MFCEGYRGGLCIAGAAVGTLLGTGVSAAVRNSVSNEEMDEWGWRIPFLLTPVVGLFGYAVRRNLIESEAFEEEAQKAAESGEDISKSQIYRDVFKYHWIAITLGALSLVSWCPTFYLVFTWFDSLLLYLE
jgi:MFS family permease